MTNQPKNPLFTRTVASLLLAAAVVTGTLSGTRSWAQAQESPTGASTNSDSQTPTNRMSPMIWHFTTNFIPNLWMH